MARLKTPGCDNCDCTDGDAPPTITSQPTDKCVDEDGSISFSLTAIGSSPLEYDWFKFDGVDTWEELDEVSPYSGVNSNTLTIDPADIGLDGSLFRCRVRNIHGEEISDEVTLAVGDCVECSCGLEMKVLGESGFQPYDDYAAAAAAIAVQVDACRGVIDKRPSMTINQFAVTRNPTSVDIVADTDLYAQVSLSLSLKAGTNLSITGYSVGPSEDSPCEPTDYPLTQPTHITIPLVAIQFWATIGGTLYRFTATGSADVTATAGALNSGTGSTAVDGSGITVEQYDAAFIGDTSGAHVGSPSLTDCFLGYGPDNVTGDIYQINSASHQPPSGKFIVIEVFGTAQAQMNSTDDEILFYQVPGSSGCTLDSVSGTKDPGLRMLLRRCLDFSTADSDYSSAPSGNLSVTAPDDGTYILQLIAQGDDSTTHLEATVDIDQVFVLNPAIAFWNDGGTPRVLEACPKMLIPPLTESTGDWYANCAAAVAAIVAKVSACTGYFALNGSSLDSFSATGGGSLVLSAGKSGGVNDTGDMWGSINAVVGDTISTAWTGGSHAAVTIYDIDGNVIYDDDGTSPLVSGAIPFTGRYIVKVRIDDADITNPATSVATVTSSGGMSTNNVQALYDTGLICPERIDCGDTCP